MNSDNITFLFNRKEVYVAFSGSPSQQIFHFGSFEANLWTGELRKDGVKLRVQEQPLKILAMLLARPGELVTRKQLREGLWSNDTFVDFDRGLNTAVNRLRAALNDSAEKPRFVETVGGRGYRFIGTVDSVAAKAPKPREVGEKVASPVSEFLDSIAVLPFEDVGGEPDTEYLSDGITASIISNLSQLRRLRVVPRTTAFHYKGKVIDVSQVGRDLHVRVVLTGQVAQRGDSLIVNVELIDTIHDSQLWGDNYHRRVEDIFSVQTELAGEITNRLQLRLNDDEKRQLAKRPSENRVAYHLYMKGLHWANKWTPEGVRKGVDYTRQAIDADPVYAEAWAALAYLYVLIGFFGGAPPIEIFTKAKAAALKALEIDDGQADAHSALAFIRLVYDWDWQGSEV
jgi:TolB-like protein